VSTPKLVTADAGEGVSRQVMPSSRGKVRLPDWWKTA